MGEVLGQESLYSTEHCPSVLLPVTAAAADADWNCLLCKGWKGPGGEKWSRFMLDPQMSEQWVLQTSRATVHPSWHSNQSFASRQRTR